MTKAIRVLTSWPLILLCVLISIAMLGASFLGQPNFLLLEPHKLDALREIGVAVLASVLIGYVLGISFSQRLTEDAFKATMGYLLPDFLKSELEWVYNLKIVAESSMITLSFSIDESDPNRNAMKVQTEVQRRFKNHSSSTQELAVETAVDEWNHPCGKKSEILHIDYSYREKTIGIEKEALRAELTDTGDSVFSNTGVILRLQPGETATITVAIVEFKNLDDHEILNFEYVTKETSVWLEYGSRIESYAFLVYFGHRNIAKPVNRNCYELQSTLLPGQLVRIRWRPQNSKKPRRVLEGPQAEHEGITKQG